MAKKKTKARAKRSPADELEAMPGEKASTWFTRLPAQRQADILAIRESHLAGRLQHHSLAAIWKWCRSRFGDGIPSKSAFNDWMQNKGGKDDGQT